MGVPQNLPRILRGSLCLSLVVGKVERSHQGEVGMRVVGNFEALSIDCIWEGWGNYPEGIGILGGYIRTMGVLGVDSRS